HHRPLLESGGQLSSVREATLPFGVTKRLVTTATTIGAATATTPRMAVCCSSVRSTPNATSRASTAAAAAPRNPTEMTGSFFMVSSPHRWSVPQSLPGSRPGRRPDQSGHSQAPHPPAHQSARTIRSSLLLKQSQIDLNVGVAPVGDRFTAHTALIARPAGTHILLEPGRAKRTATIVGELQ